MTPEEQINDLFLKKGCMVTGTRMESTYYKPDGFKIFNLTCNVPGSLPIKTYWSGFKLDYKIEDLRFTTGNTQTSPLIENINCTGGSITGDPYYDYK